jgi:hypothetical protein
MTDMNISMNAADAQKAIAAIEKQLQTLRAFVGLPAAVPAKGKKAKVAAAADATVPEKTRELSPAIAKMNEERKAIFEELKAAWLSANADYVSLDAKALAAAIKNGECEPKPLYAAALQEHSRRQREGNPEAEAKYAAYRAKVEQARSEKSGASSVASAEKPAEPVAEKKARKNPWEGLTEEQKKERVAKMQDAKKAKKAAATPAAAPLPAAPKDAEVVEASEDDEEAFAPFTLEVAGVKQQYWKNGLQYVYKKTSDGGFGNYAGRYDTLKKKIDATVPEPPVE